MRYSRLFGKTLRQAPKEASAANHKLLIRGGFIDQLMAGSWTLLPLGWRVIVKISQIIREEINATGAQEMLMPLMHPAEIWKETSRWETCKEIMYQLKDSRKKDLGLGFTHEEIVLDFVRKQLKSYADLPIKLYQFSTKFRNEIRASGGILRGREFLMKDLYSLHATEEDFWQYYEEVKKTYSKIFARLGLRAIVTEASGGVFTDKHTHEFQIESGAGEDTIFVDPKTGLGINKEIFTGQEKDYQKISAVEVGNIFAFGTYYSEKMGVTFTDKNSQRRPAWFGSYGIGTSRLLGVIVEVYHDDKGIIWPEEVAPYKAHFVSLSSKLKVQSSKMSGEKIYEALTKAGVEVLYDDREEVSAGEKFADADLIGCPVRLVVSERTGERVEWKRRGETQTKILTVEQAIKALKL